MRLLLLSWDAARPGWLDPDVAGLAAAMVDQGAKVEVVSVGTGGGPAAPERFVSKLLMKTKSQTP